MQPITSRLQSAGQIRFMCLEIRLDSLLTWLVVVQHGTRLATRGIVERQCKVLGQQDAS